MSEQIYNPELKGNEIDHSKVVNQNIEKPTIYGNVPSYQVSGLGEYKRDDKVNMADIVYGLDELNYQRADLQSGAELTGKFFANLASEAIIETAKVPGYLFELGEFVANGFEAEDGFNNEYLDKLNSFKEPTQFDIYKTQSAESGSIWEKLSDPTFIASQGQTVGTTLSLMVPGISVAGLTGRAAAGLSKAAQIGLSGAAAGLFSRGIESAMEGNSIYNEYLQDENRLNEIRSEEFEKRKNELSELKSKYDNLNSVIYNPGSKDETYNLNNAIRNGQIIEIESRINGIREEIEESSKNRLNDEASRASTLGFAANMALAPLDMLEYALLLKPFSSIKKGIDAISKTKVAKVIGGAVAQPAMESMEEGTQFAISEEAIGAASGKHDFFNNGFSDRLSNYIEDPEFHESVALGGAMGLLFSGAGPLAKNAYNRISKNVSKFKDDKVLKDKDKVADIVKSGKNEIVSRALINSDDTYDYLEREKVRLKQFSDSEIEKAKTEEEKSEIKSNYDSIISDLNEIRELDESLKSDEVFIDNPNARKQYVLAKYDYKKNLDKKNEAKSKFEEEFNSIDINSDFSNINLKEGATISEVEEITSNLLKENISLTSYENVRREISKIKSKNSELKSKAEKTIDESIKHTKNRIESLQSQLNEKVNNHNEALPVVPNMESMVNNMTNFIKANIDETFFIKPILNSYSTAKADLIKKKENEIAKKVNDKAQKILEDELSNIIDSTDATVEELNKKKEDIKAFESKSGLKISKKIKSKLDDKLKNAKIKYDLELIEQKNKYIDKINNSNVEELESIAEELRSDSSIEESTFDELINIILSKQINAQNDKINKENELKNIIVGTDKSGKDVKGEHVKRNNKDFIKSDDKLIPVTNIRKPEIINPVIEKNVVKPEEIVFKNTNKNTENTIGFYNQPIGEVQESEIESTQLDNKENESLLTTKVKEFVNDNGKILDAYDESGELIVTDKNKLELSSQNNYNEGDEVIFVIDKTFLKEVNGEWFVVYGNSLSKLTKDNLPIGIQTVKDFKDKKPLIGWAKASKQSNGDKQLRSFLYKELVENGVPNFNKTISSIISKKGEGWINKTKVAKLFNKQFKKINKDGAFIYPSNIALAHSNINNEIIGTDEEGNILKSKIQDSPGTVHLVFKNSNGTVNSIRISQKPISKHSESLRKEWVTNVFRIIIDHALGNREFTDDANDVRREVSKYFNLNTFADKSLQEKIRISNDDEYNNFFGFGIDANSGDMILQLPGNNGFPFMQFKIVKSDDNLFILKYGKDGEYNNISSSELLKEFYERLGNMFPNIVSDRLSNFRRLEFDNKSKKLQWTQPKHYFDFLSEYKIAETKLHALVTESGEAVYTTSPMIIVDNNIKHLSESDNIKPEVSELFESNPELANSVYEALEFTGNISDEQKQQKADIERRREEKLDKANKRVEKTNKKEDRRVKVETYRTLDIGGNPVEVEITTKADGSRLLRARQVNEDGSIEPMAYATERINNKAQATLTNEKLIEGYVGNEDNTLQRTNIDENPDQTYIDKINAKYDAELAELNNQITPEQKQQAQQLYSSYLQTTNNPTIEGFKQWNNRQKQTKVSKLKIENPKLFDSNPELDNQVYETLGFDKKPDEIPNKSKISELLNNEEYNSSVLEIVLDRELKRGYSKQDVVLALYNASKLNNNQDSFGSLLQSVKLREQGDKTLGEKRRIAKYDAELAEIEQHSQPTLIKQIQKKENLPPLPKGKYALDKDTDSLNNEVSDLSPEDYNNASLESFNANIDVLNTLVSNVLERLDSQLAETGNTNLEEALNLEKEDLFEMYNIYNFFSKENISKQLADEYGISTKASDNATMANNFKQIYDNFEKIVNSKDEITFIGYRDLITTNIKKLKFSILNEINEDESDGDKVLETYVENRNFKEDPEKSMSGKIRRLFYKIPVLLKDGKVKGNILGQKVFHDSSNVFNQISDILIDISPEDMISELENAAYGENGEVINDIAHGVLVKLYELQKSNPETMQMFKSVMKKQQANFITLIYEPPKVKNGYPIAKIIYTNRASSSNSIVSDWQESFYDKIIEKKYIGDDGKIDENFGKQLYKTIDSLKPGTLKEDVLSILSEIGISFNEKAYLSIVKDFNKKSKYFIKRFGKKAYSEDLILFFKNELFPIANSIKNGNDPFESEARAILNFAAYEAKFSIDSTSRMFKNSNGDNIFTYVNPSHASNLLNRLINNLDETTKLIKDPFIGKSTILNSIHNYNKLNSKKELTESEVNELKELSNEISYLKMFYFEASKNKGGWAIAREYETQSVVERELTKISLFLNNGKNSGMIFNPTPSDKTTFSLFQFKKFDTSSFVIKDGKIVSKVDRENEFNTQLNKLISLFVQSEISRINHVISLFKNAKSNNNFSKLIEGFHYIKKGDEYYPGVGAHFMFMTNLNDFTANNNMRNQDGSISITNDMSKMIVEEMKFGILELINSKIDSWKNFGLIENGKFKYIDKSVSSKSIDGFAIEYVINNMVGLANEFMMKTGDPAQFAKINTDNIDISFENSNELIEQTHFNMFKRIAKDIAPGREADWGSDSEYNVLMIDEPKINSKLGEVFSKYKKAYSNIKLADAQEWTTLKEHLTVKLKYGEITKEQYDELLEAGNNKNLSFNQILLVLNPMKPVQVMNEFDNELGQYVSTYIKTSSFPLIPQLTEKFKELDNVREFMELNNINRIVPKSAVKTGFRKSFDLKNITNSKFTNNFVLKNQDEFLIKLDRSGFRIQQDVPYSFSKEHYKEGSQLRKLIFANLLNEDGTEIFFNVNNSEYSGFELKKLNDEIHQEFYERRFDKLLLKLGAVKTSDGVFLPNVDEIRNLLIQEAESRGYSINDILALKSVNLNNKTIFETSLFFHPMVHKIEQLLTSIIKNKVLVNKYPGKSFVQGSSLNFNVATEDLLKLYDNKNSVIFSKDYNPEDGLQYKVNEDGSVVAQVFITMPFKDSKGQPLSIENYLDVNNKIDFNKLPKNMLEMIGYRIPTQGPNSMVKLEVVGILPEIMGDLVIVPPEITVQMGSDFDVDKLNIHWYNYNVDKYGVVSKINYNEEEYLLYKKFVKSKILEKEGIDEELLDSIDNEVKALLDNNYSKFKKSWNNYRKKLSKTLGNDKIVKEFVLDDEYKNVWLPKFKEVSEQIVKTYTISQISELASDYDIISFDEFKKMPMVKKLSMKQLENLSIDTYMSVLSSGLIAERIIAPLENNYFDEAIEYINSLKGNNKSKKSEIKLNNSVLNEKLHSDMVAVQSAGKIGVAIESMASTFHALSQFAGLSLINNPVLFSKKENGDDIYTDADINDNMSPTGNTMNQNVKYVTVHSKGAFRLDKVFSFSDRLISDIISNIQTEAVDNANNRKLYPMNLNPITFDVANLIARVGFDEKIIGLFLNQPIILEYVKRLESLNSFFDADASFENVKSLQVEMLNGLGLNISINDLDKLRSSNISIEEMENSISNNDLTSKTQLIALQNFIIYSNIANELRDIQSVANIDTKFLGSSISELEEKNDFFKNQNIKEIGNWENLFYDSESTKTTQGAAYEYGVTSSIDLFKNILPIDSIFLNKIKSNIERLTKRKIKSKDIEKIQIDLRSAIYWHVIKDLFNIDTNTYRKDLISGENNLGKRLIDFKNSNKNNSFTNSLSVFRPNSKSEHIEVHHFSSKNDKEDVSLKKQLEWLKMLNSDKNSEEFKLGFDLLIYATTFGTEKNANDFSRFIPIDYLRNSGILSGINKFSFNETNENAITIDAYKSFYSQFLRHNPRYASKFDAKDIFFEKGEKLTDINNEVIIDNNSELYDDNGRLPFAIKTYVDKELRLYFRSKGNKYSRVGLLGSTPGAETNLLSEYDLANKYNKSIFNDNFNKEFNEYVDIHNTAGRSPEDVILSDYNFNSGIEAVLKRISTIGTSNENKELAKLYLEKINLIKEFKLEEYNPENPIHYNAQKGENLNKKGATIRRETGEMVIVINKHAINTNYFSMKREDFEHTFLHEIGHSITVEILLNYGYATKEQRLIINEIDKIISEFKDDAPLELKYFFKNNREFVTSVLSNKKMQNYLNSKTYKTKNLLSEILNLIKKLIGYNPVQNTALSAAMDNILRFTDSISESQMNEIRIESKLPITIPTYVMDYATKIKNKCL